MVKKTRPDRDDTTEARKSVIPGNYLMAFVLVTSLFFLWAIAHNMNDILIPLFCYFMVWLSTIRGHVQKAAPAEVYLT